MRVQFYQLPRDPATDDNAAANTHAVVGPSTACWTEPTADIECRRCERQTWSPDDERLEVLSKSATKQRFAPRALQLPMRSADQGGTTVGAVHNLQSHPDG